MSLSMSMISLALKHSLNIIVMMSSSYGCKSLVTKSSLLMIFPKQDTYKAYKTFLYTFWKSSYTMLLFRPRTVSFVYDSIHVSQVPCHANSCFFEKIRFWPNLSYRKFWYHLIPSWNKQHTNHPALNLTCNNSLLLLNRVPSYLNSNYNLYVASNAALTDSHTSTPVNSSNNLYACLVTQPRPLVASLTTFWGGRDNRHIIIISQEPEHENHQLYLSLAIHFYVYMGKASIKQRECTSLKGEDITPGNSLDTLTTKN